MPTLQAAIKAKVDALQNVPIAWADGVMRLQPTILARMQLLTSQLATDGDGTMKITITFIVHDRTI